jgi:hypothetical protein
MWFGASSGALSPAAKKRAQRPNQATQQVLALSLCTSQTFQDSRKGTRIPGPFRTESTGGGDDPSALGSHFRAVATRNRHLQTYRSIALTFQTGMASRALAKSAVWSR